MYTVSCPAGTGYITLTNTKGDAAYNTLDSLSAFWPGLQVLAGDVENAIQSHLICKPLSIFAFIRDLTIIKIGIYGKNIQVCRKVRLGYIG